MRELKIILNKNADVRKLNDILCSGGVIAFVTDTVWGIGCLPQSKKGAERIYEIKSRDRAKPLILMSDNADNLKPYVKNINGYTQNLIDKYFPGALTIVSEKSHECPDFITSGKNTVGIRVPDNKFFSLLCSKIKGHVLATTSANLSGEPASKTFDETKKSVGDYVDILFPDYGYTCRGRESTVILTQDFKPIILRQGSVLI